MRCTPQPMRLALTFAASLLAAWPASAQESAPAAPRAEAPATKHTEAPPPQETEGTATDSAAAGLVSKANNPLTAASAINLQEFYSSSLYGEPTSQSNSLLLRAVLPFKLGAQQLLRATLPLATPPNVEGSDPKSGLGDLNVFDLFVLTGEESKLQFGIGPMVTLPTAYERLGTGKWQVGVAAVPMWQPAKTVLLGALFTFQEGIAGDSARRATNELIVQPIAIIHVGQGFYLRSTATESYNFISGQYVVPLGVGVGKVIKVGGFAFNLYLEPQFTILHRGQGQPTLQVAGGFNVQYFHAEPAHPERAAP